MTPELGALLEHVPLPAYVVRVEGDAFLLEAVSAAALADDPGFGELTGHPMHELYGHVPEALRDAKRCISERTTVTREISLRRHDRTEVSHDVRLTFVPLPPDHLVVFSQDISTPARAEMALRESEARYRSLIKSMPDAIVLRDTEGRVLACNDLAVRLLGAKSQADLLGKRPELGRAHGHGLLTENGEVVPAEQFPGLRVLSTGLPEIGRTYVLRAAGRTGHFRVSSQPIYSAGGAVTGSVTTCTDVTEQRRLEEELRRASRLESLGRLAGGIAHDFNNLLAAMMGAVELLSPNVLPQGREDLETIRHGAERARDLTRQLLAFAKKQPVEFKVIDLASTVTNVHRMLERLVGQDVELSIACQGPVPVRADPALLEQVLMNLVVNAKEATPRGGKVTVHVGPGSGAADSALPGALAVLEVSDSGVGMDEETRARLFDPFFTTKESGTGLGLASSYGIVKQHGGEIVVDSRPGRGTRFRVLLPRLDEALSPAPPPRESPVPGSSGCVLVVDDDDLVRAATARMVTSLGYEVLSAGTDDLALSLARTHPGPIHFLLCDVAMPGRGGPAVARELKALRPEMKVLFVSGYAETAALGGAEFLQKPYGADDLARKLSSLDTPRKEMITP